ncbi:MAG: hypothetical protein IKN84_08615 [Bacteroidales bacterium]|nr:hypothetical protein [Bacteroidales bacterium]
MSESGCKDTTIFQTAKFFLQFFPDKKDKGVIFNAIILKKNYPLKKNLAVFFSQTNKKNRKYDVLGQKTQKYEYFIDCICFKSKIGHL